MASWPNVLCIFNSSLDTTQIVDLHGLVVSGSPNLGGQRTSKILLCVKSRDFLTQISLTPLLATSIGFLALSETVLMDVIPTSSRPSMLM